VTEEIDVLRLALQSMNNVTLWQTNRKFPNKKPYNAMHPLTCGNDSNHTPLFPYWNGASVILMCRDCDYTQKYVPECVTRQVDGQGPVSF
jgi:hypothetical protein